MPSPSALTVLKGVQSLSRLSSCRFSILWQYKPALIGYFHRRAIGTSTLYSGNNSSVITNQVQNGSVGAIGRTIKTNVTEDRVVYIKGLTKKANKKDVESFLQVFGCLPKELVLNVDQNSTNMVSTLIYDNAELAGRAARILLNVTIISLPPFFDAKAFSVEAKTTVAPQSGTIPSVSQLKGVATNSPDISTRAPPLEAMDVVDGSHATSATTAANTTNRPPSQAKLSQPPSSSIAAPSQPKACDLPTKSVESTRGDYQQPLQGAADPTQGVLLYATALRRINIWALSGGLVPSEVFRPITRPPWRNETGGKSIGPREISVRCGNV
jgi:hypothetical protein